MLSNPEWINSLTYEEFRNLKRKYWTFVYWGEGVENDVDNDFRVHAAHSLESMVIPSLISPYHDSDLKEDGSIAKRHVHVIVMNEQPIRYNLMLKTLQCGCGFENLNYLQPVANLHSMMRYLCHLDNPDKVQYNPLDVIRIAGAEYVIESESAQLLVINYLTENEDCCSLGQLLNHYSCSPSVQKFIVKNIGFINVLLNENRSRIYKSVSLS